MGLSQSKTSKCTESSTNALSRKIKSKHSNTDYSDMERNNIYARTPPKLNLPTQMPVFHQRRPPIPTRTDSTRSAASTTSSAKSIYDIEPSIYNKTYLPLQSVYEDKYLDTNEHFKNEHDQQRLVMDLFKQNYLTSEMSKLNSSHQGLSTTDDDLSSDLNRNHRLRSSLPFIIKPAAKSNSLGLCFLICGNETKKILLPAYISCLDTLKALFVRAFPHHLTMKQMETDNIRIYIREMEKDIFYQLEDVNDVKDRSVLKLIYLNNSSKPHVSFKQPEIDNEISSSRSLSEPKLPVALKGILSSSKNDDDDDDNDNNEENYSNMKMILMEKQLKSLTELVQELTKSKPNRSLHEQIYDLKMKINILRQELISIRDSQESFKQNLQIELKHANENIQKQFLRLNQNELNAYIKSREKIDQDLEDLEIAVEELQNDVKTKQCYVTMNDVESFALVLSTISRALVDLKTSFPHLCEKLSLSNEDFVRKFLKEEPECLDFTIKKCKRLTTMLYQLKRLSMNQENKCPKKLIICVRENLVDREQLLEEIRSVTSNSDERIKAIERAERLRERRLFYENQLENLKNHKSEQIDGYFENHSLTNSLSTRASICSTDSNHCPSPSLSSVTRPTQPTNECKSRLKPPTKVTFSQQVLTHSNQKSKVDLPPRVPNTPPSSSAVSSASSSSSSSCIGGLTASRFCGIIPLLTMDRRNNGRCYSFSSSSTDTDSVISNSQKSPIILNKKYQQTPLMRASVTDL